MSDVAGAGLADWGLLRFKKDARGKPLALSVIFCCAPVIVVPRREAVIKPAALLTWHRFAWKHEVDRNGVWGPWPQKTFYNSGI
jgi:hypothetical protein